MYHCFGPCLIPTVFPVVYNDTLGIASSELTYFGTLFQLAKQMGYSEKEIQYGASALTVIDGKTYLQLKEKSPVRVKGRIDMKVALRMLVAHYDIESHHKNFFMVLANDPVKHRQVACPGTFDLGCVFHPEQMQTLIEAYAEPEKRAAFVRDLAENAVDAHVEELNIQGYEQIKNRFPTKCAAFQLSSEFPVQSLQEGLRWFKANAPEEAYAHIDTIGRFLFCSRGISKEVSEYISTHLLHKEESKMVEENIKRPIF